MCPHGAPDDGDVLKYPLTYRLDDMAELAVRLGSSYDYHRGGDVIFLDDFEYGLVKAIVSPLSVFGYVRVYGGTARGGGACAILNSGTVGGYYSDLKYELHYPQLVASGLKVSFSLDGNVKQACFDLFFYNGSQYQQFGVTYDQSVKHLLLWTEGGVQVVLDDAFSLYAVLECFHDLKLVFDYKSTKYIRLYLDHLEYDLSSYTSNIQSSVYGPAVLLRIRCQGNGVVAGNMCVDSIVVTQHE
jgi:hypothetical protein